MTLILLSMPMSMFETGRTVDVDEDVDADGLVAAKQRVRLVPPILVIILTLLLPLLPLQHHNNLNDLTLSLVSNHQHHHHRLQMPT